MGSGGATTSGLTDGDGEDGVFGQVVTRSVAEKARVLLYCVSNSLI